MPVKKEGIEEEMLRQMYEDKMMSIATIASFYHVGDMTIHRRMKEYGIMRRSSWETNTIYTTEEERREAKRKNAKRYRQSKRGKEYVRGFIKLEVCKSARRKYQQSDKGKENAKRYCQSDKGKEANRKAMEKYQKTEKFKEANRKHQFKHRQLGFIPLNDSFCDCESHHIDKEHVVFIPKGMHRGVYHNIWTGQGMREINAIAFEYLKGTYDNLGGPKA